MTMPETEQSILSDLDMLGDGLNRMEYILGCAREDPGIPEGERRKEDLVADCQMNTWLSVRWERGVLNLRTDSESLLVKGALSLIGEIYSGRGRAEVGAYTCALLTYDSFADLLNSEQKKGLQTVLNTLKGGAQP